MLPSQTASSETNMAIEQTRDTGEKFSQIQSLTVQANTLRRSRDRWNDAYMVLVALTVILAAFVFITQFIAGKKSKQLEDVQDRLNEASNEELQASLKEKDLRIAEAQAASNKATLRAAEAKQHSLETELELAKFKSPRSIPPEQQQKLISALKPFAGQNFAFAVFPDPEPLALLRIVNELLRSAGWKRVPSQLQRQGGVLLEAAGESAASISDSGIDAYVAPDETDSVPAQIAFCVALSEAGIPCERHRTPQLAGKLPRAITISIGKKP